MILQKQLLKLNFIKGLCLLMAVALSSSVASDVSYAQQCRAFEQIIVTLRQPIYGYPSVWDAAFSPDKQKKFEFDSVLHMEQGTALLIGRGYDSKDKVEKISFVELNRRGRPMRQVHYDALMNEKPIRLLRHKNGYFVLSSFEIPGRLEGQVAQQKSTRRIRLTWYDEELKLTDEKIISDPDYDLVAHSIASTINGDGFIIVMEADNIVDQYDIHGVVAEYSDDGEERWKRSYRVGIPNRLMMIKRVDDRSYVAVGRIQTSNKEYSGWAMKLDRTGAILWQKTYRVGLGGELKGVIVKEATDSFTQPLFTFAGSVRPNDGKPDAAWVIRTDSLGQQTWQRYFRMDDHGLSADWIRDYGDGRMLLVVNARRERGTDARDHIRMLALSPRGVLLSDESYIEGYRSNATDFIIGAKRERIVSAYTEIDLNATEKIDPIRILGINNDEQEAREQQQAEDQAAADNQYLEFSQDFSSIVNDNDHRFTQRKKEVRKKGWVLLAPALDRYIDPCAPKE